VDDSPFSQCRPASRPSTLQAAAAPEAAYSTPTTFLQGQVTILQRLPYTNACRATPSTSFSWLSSRDVPISGEPARSRPSAKAGRSTTRSWASRWESIRLHDNFGRLTYEIWRACRLVIDTSIHSRGWTREQAIKYLRVNTALPEHEIETEVDRYISWPAQALSYKLGEMQIVELRKEAEEKLGPKFNIRSFHDALLGMGVVPLPVMRQQMKKFIQSGGVDAGSPNESSVTTSGETWRSVGAIQTPTLPRSDRNAF
jgi:hypothetical protein